MAPETGRSPPPALLGMHHVALICSDYARSRRFYTELLGLPVLAEHFRAERQSWKLDLALPDGTALEPVRVDEFTGRRFTFFADPDGLPLELYEEGR
jgi:glyoxylase I family protein